MTARAQPLFVRETKAAYLMDMHVSEFRGLWKAGALPGPEDIAGKPRWRVSKLEAIESGAAMDEDFEP